MYAVNILRIPTPTRAHHTFKARSRASPTLPTHTCMFTQHSLALASPPSFSHTHHTCVQCSHNTPWPSPSPPSFSHTPHTCVCVFTQHPPSPPHRRASPTLPTRVCSHNTPSPPSFSHSPLMHMMLKPGRLVSTTAMQWLPPDSLRASACSCSLSVGIACDGVDDTHSIGLDT